VRRPEPPEGPSSYARPHTALARLTDLWRAVGDIVPGCHPATAGDPSVSAMAWTSGPHPGWAIPLLASGASRAAPIEPGAAGTATATLGTDLRTADVLDVDAFVVRLFRAEGLSLVRLARLFVDDRNAAEDLVQEAFIRLARSADRIREPEKAAAYLRSIVLNLARDHNRRGLVSLRHQLPLREPTSGPADENLVLREDQQEVLEALRELPRQQRNCVVLRHLEEQGIADIAETLGISENSVKTHLKRGMAALATRLGEPS
jgi:RNA polymerase sigma-70 factor (sigma-E family)